MSPKMRHRRVVMSGSDEQDSESEQLTPSEETLEKALRRAVANVFRTGALDELTVRRMRAAAERALGLHEGFFKGHARWKVRSGQVIKDEVLVQEEAIQSKPAKTPKEPSPPPSRTSHAQTAKRTKTEEPLKPRKRRRTTTPPESEEYEGSARSSDESEGDTKKTVQPEISEEDSSDKSDVEAVEPPKPSIEGDASESEMSVVLDEPPKPSRKRQKSAETSSGKGKKKAAGRGEDADLDPNQAEIKRLQGWLVKCGIRKLWSRELASYETPKAKIRHLKNMLKEAGMEGRYSLEKAKQIREERELKADLELVQEGARRWGTGSADEESDSGKPRRRRLTRGFKSLAFLDGEQEGEETE